MLLYIFDFYKEETTDAREGRIMRCSSLSSYSLFVTIDGDEKRFVIIRRSPLTSIYIGN